MTHSRRSKRLLGFTTCRQPALLPPLPPARLPVAVRRRRRSGDGGGVGGFLTGAVDTYEVNDGMGQLTQCETGKGLVMQRAASMLLRLRTPDPAAVPTAHEHGEPHPHARADAGFGAIWPSARRGTLGLWFKEELSCAFEMAVERCFRGVY